MEPEAQLPRVTLIAILRGVTPERVVDIGDVLYHAGFRCVEVPLNSPDPFASIAALARSSRADWSIGAGTVLSVEDVRRTKDSGGQLAVAPNCDVDVIHAALQLGVQPLPGFATASEAFRAIQAGARRLKLFPASTYGPRHLQALHAVLPAAEVFPVGGVAAQDVAGWLAAGACGFGFGSELFRPEFSLAEIGRRATQLVDAVRAAELAVAAPTSGRVSA
jgi:2-dehydro-3-deoxyphosphogalactonate aldolase